MALLLFSHCLCLPVLVGGCGAEVSNWNLSLRVLWNENGRTALSFEKTKSEASMNCHKKSTQPQCANSRPWLGWFGMERCQVRKYQSGLVSPNYQHLS